MTRANRRGPWLPDEDQTLLRLVCTQGPNNWVRISQHMQHRSPKQCRERYHQNLKPSLNHEPISSQEGEMIEQMVTEMGKRWAEIARRLGNRSDNAVKNWWNGSMNRRKRNVVHHGHGMKGVGNRMQPISATKPLKAPSDRIDHRRLYSGEGHHYNTRWTEPHEDHLMRPLGSYQDSYQSVHAPYTYPVYDAQTGRDRYLPSLDHVRPNGVNHPQSSVQDFGHGAEPLPSPQHQMHFGRHAPPTLMFSAHPMHDMPLISPNPTEISNAPSLDRAPSLMSDNQSIYSISPKTAPSPRPDMPAPIDTDIHAWAQRLSQRRVSGPNVLPELKSHGKMHADEGYVSALPQSAASDSKLPLPVPTSNFQYRGSGDCLRSSHNYSPTDYGSANATLLERTSTVGSADSRKDTRMHLSNLLG